MTTSIPGAPLLGGTELLDEITDAAGGARRWAELTRIDVGFELGGGLWAQFGQPGLTGHIDASVSTREQRVQYRAFGSPDVSAEYTPSEVVLREANGALIERRADPRSVVISRGGPPWDLADATYFAGYALWNYLNVPHLFRRPDVRVVELEPWTEVSAHTIGLPETWRRVEVTFPDSIATHNATQVFYFDDDGLQRRHDYAADVFGGAPTAHYTERHREFDGLVLPTRRRVVPRDAVTGLTGEGPVLVSLDLVTVIPR
ncbi:hypothetical protein ACFPER_14460 [Agromyces aurantiacus]|uniref:Uncharacterized protein n=1 Tax=Agromyces aurantiacus TaxID=165814 RepID=A0ABV9R884_9MICO|nr:hypothetical protein [Agromyces aurantiacus]MBM7505103.1 hypothetical protein [Agromyces aurantiacus]